MSAHASAVKTSSGAVKSAPGQLVAVVLTAGSDAATLTIYDNTAGSGTVLCVLKAAANTSASAYLGGMVARIGLYASLTGTSPSATVVYD